MTSKHFKYLIIIAIIIHLITLFMYVTDVIPQQTKREDKIFWFHHGGDEYGYLELAYGIHNNDLTPSRLPLGYALLLQPALWFISPADYDNLIQPISFFWAIIMFPVALVMCAWLARRMANHLAGGLAAVWYASFPLLAFISIWFLWNNYMAEIISIHLTWAQMLSDGPTAFLTLLGAVLYFKARDTNYHWLVVGFLGICLGLMVLVRYSAAIFPVIVGFLFLADRQFASLAMLVTIAFMIFMPQLVYNYHFFGNPFETGYQSMAFVPDTGLFHHSYLINALELIWQYLGILTPVFLLMGLLVLGYSLYIIQKREPAAAVLIGGWLVGYVIFYSLYYYSWTGAMMRFMIPAMPALAIILGVFTENILMRLTRKSPEQVSINLID